MEQFADKSGQTKDLATHAPAHVAVDLGAGSGRVILGQVVDGALQMCEVSRFTNSFDRDPATGYECWDIDAIESNIRDGIAKASTLANVASVGVDSWGVDFVLLDAALQRVGPAVCYRDARTQGMIELLASRIPAATIYRKTGIQFQPYNSLYQLAAIARREPQWVSQARHLLLIPDYLHFKLSGVLSNEYTNATTTQALNLDGSWDRELLTAAGLADLWMKPTVDAGTVLGDLQMAGLQAKVVAPATHDTASAVFGTPLESEDEVYLSSGTWSLMGIESLAPLAGEDALRMNFSNEGGFGRRYRVLKNIMGLWILQRFCQEQKIEIGAALLDEAAAAQPWRSILNADDQRFLNPPSMKAALLEFFKETAQPLPATDGEFARCILEGLSLCYRKTKDELQRLSGRALTRIRIVGGGSKNALLNQMCANACQLPVSAGPVEASAMGNLCAQMIAMGAMSGIAEARALIRRSARIEEFQPMHAVPGDAWRRFQELACTQEAVI